MSQGGGLSSSGSGTTSPLTTVGDLYGYDGSNARIPIGVDGQVLIADSTDPSGLGVKWAAASGSGAITWNVVTDAIQALSTQNGYIGNRGTSITYTLPDTAPVGSIVIITNFGVGLPSIAQHAGESIHFTASTTSVGVGGSLTAIDQFSSLELVCVVADTEWIVLSSIGNWTVL